MNSKCKDCCKTFIDDFRLYQHNLSKLHSCQHCGTATASKTNLMQHMRTHMIYECEKCSKTFFLVRSQEQHMEMSTHTKKPKTRRKKKRGERSGVTAGIQSAAGKSLHSSLPSVAGAHLGSSPPGLTRPSSKERSPSTKPRFVIDLERYASTETFLKEKVIPDQDTLDECSEVVDELANFLQHLTEYKVAKVYKGGSLAKGTSIKMKNDIDLVVYLNDFKTVPAMSRGMEKVLKYIRDQLKTATFADQIELKGTDDDFTSHSLQFKLKCSRDDELHAVDLLPAVDMVGEASGSLESVYRQMLARKKKRSFYSVCFSQEQVEFVKQRPPRVKELIRLVKHWKQIEKVDQLKSYHCELIVIKQWQKWGEPKTFDLKDKMRDILAAISDLKSLNIEWPEKYDISEYNGLLNDPVIIMDPANPFMNTADRIRGDKKIRKIEAKARRTLACL